MAIEVDEGQIEQTMYKACDVSGTQYPGMTYEDGIEAALRWVLSGEDNPMGED